MRYALSVFKGKSFRVLPLILGLIIALFVGSHSPASPTKLTELLWDTYGVPHIYGKDARSAFHVFGAMLLANPHLPWSDLFLWYETQLTAPGIDAYGATLVGLPVLAIA